MSGPLPGFSAVETDVTAEATARAAADTTLQTNITAEATTRAAADTTLAAADTTEAAARAAADALLIPLTQKAAASGVASLDSSSKVVQEPASKAAASGIASLDSNSKVVQEPASKAQASGIASLNSSSLVVQNPANATATATPSKIPIADGSGLLDTWITAPVPLSQKAAASGVASLDGSSLVVQNPANATATATASKIPIADANALLDSWNSPLIVPQLRCYRCPLPVISAAFTPTAAAAYFVYIGYFIKSQAVKYINFLLTSNASGTPTVSCGLFSSPLAPNKSAQVMTKLVATGTFDDMTTGAVASKRSANLAYTIPAGTHVWAAINFSFTTTMPQTHGHYADMDQGYIQKLASAGALTGAGPFSPALIASSTSAMGPALSLEID